MTMQAKTAINNVSVSLPVRAALTLIQLAGRAPLLDAERLWLDGIDAQVAQTLRAWLAQPEREPGG